MQKKKLRRKILARVFILFFLLLILLWQTSSQEKQLQEAMFRGDRERSGTYISQNYFNFLKPKWQKIRIEGESFSSPVVVDNTIFLGSKLGNFYAFDLKTGEKKWTYKTEGDTVSSPAIEGSTIYFGSHDGNLYALSTVDGYRKWTFSTDQKKFIDSSPAVSGGTVYFGSHDNNLYAISAVTGIQKWKFKTGDIVSSSPAVWEGIVYFGSYDHYFYALDAKTGKEKWRFKTSDSIFSSPLVVDGFVYFGSHDKKFYALDAKTGKEKWRFKADWIHSSPAYKDGIIYFGSGDRSLYALDAKTGKEKWRFKTKGAIVSSPALNDNLICFGSYDGYLYVLDVKTGKERDSYETKGPIISSAALLNGTIYFTSTDGYLYNSSAYIKNDQAIVMENTNKVKAYDIYELTISYNEEGIYNHWDDVLISVDFQGSSSKSYKVDGFYFDKNTWKVRFAPPTEGNWQWRLSFKAPTYDLTKSGSFTVSKPVTPGFIQLNKSNSFRLSFNNGKNFNSIGLNDSLINMEHGGSPFDEIGMDGQKVTLDQYLKTYGDKGAGFNLFRLSLDNANFKLWNVIEPTGNWYFTNESLWGDKLVSKLRENGFRIWLTFFGAEVPYTTDFKKEQIDAVKRYIKYVVARYGAYVDIWELTNEARPSDEWVNQISNYIRSIDPYNHLISISWERPDLSNIDINSPHWYENESEFDSDIRTVQKINEAKKFEKPIIFGEQGNKDSNWDSKSALRMRIRSWTAFLNQASLIFWNTSSLKGFIPQRESANGNIYLGDEERKYIKILQNFTSEADANLSPMEISVGNDGVRAYGLISTNQMLGYFHHFKDHQNLVTTDFEINLSSKAKVTFIDPTSGDALESFDVDGGIQTITTPKFAVDLAMRINY